MFGPLDWLGFSAGSGIIPVEYPSFIPSDHVTYTVRINRTPIEWYGMRLLEHTGSLSSFATATPEIDKVRGMTGGRVRPLGVTSPRVMSLVGHFLEVDMMTRHKLLNAFTDALRGLLEVTTPDAPNYVLRALAGAVTVDPVGALYDEPALRVTVPLVAPDAARYSRHARIVALGTTPRAVPLGNLPVGGEMVLQGPLSGTVHIDCISPQGQRIYRTTLVIPESGVASGGHVRIRLDYPTAILYVDATGVVSSVEHWRSLTSSAWWFVPALYADAKNGSFCMLRLSTGSGVYRYFEAVEH